MGNGFLECICQKCGKKFASFTLFGEDYCKDCKEKSESKKESKVEEMSMTTEQAIHCIKTDVGIDNCDCFNCTMKAICEYGEDHDLGKDYSKVAHKIAIQALEENEILHELVEDYQRQFEMMQEENKKLKEEMEFYDKYIEREEFNKLKEENERLKKSRDDFAEASSRYYTELQALKSQLSAVEVLEWFCTSCRDSRGEVFDGKEAYTEIFLDFTTQEIVDKITEYEKKKKAFDQKKCDVLYRTSCSCDTDCSDSCDMECSHEKKEEPQFKVGDWVRHKDYPEEQQRQINDFHCADGFVRVIPAGVWKIDKLEPAELPKNKLTIKDFHIGNCVKTEDGIGYISDILKSLIMVKYPDKELPQSYNPTFDYIEKIEQPKEEPQVEWVWECYYMSYRNDRYIVDGYFKTEKEAIEFCEDFANRNANDVIGYRKVCRRKEN